MNQASLLRLTALLGMLSVGLGAFGAHGLRRLVEPEQLVTFETAVRYQFYHTLALGVVAALYASPYVNVRRLRQVVGCWLAGLLLFSGSLYLLSLREVHGLPVAFLGPITPVGGLLLIAGWGLLLLVPRTAPDHVD